MPRLVSPLALGALPVAEALDRVRAALEGREDAVLPVADDPAPSQRYEALRPGTPLLDREDDESDPTALVVATSGSTGEPKGALLPASALRASASATHDRLGGPGSWLLALAPHHVAGVQVLVRSVLAGTEPGVLDLRSGFDERGFADAAERLHGRAPGRRYTALVPMQLARLLDAGDGAVEALAAFDAVLLGGAATPPSLHARARDAGIKVVTTYGMSETCGGCVYDGKPLRGVHVVLQTQDSPDRTSGAPGTADQAQGSADQASSTPRVVDFGHAAGEAVGEAAGDEARGEGHIRKGRVTLGGPVVARGYRLRPDAPEFRDDGSTRWFVTSDLGTTDTAGHLTVLGRADDVIVTGGTNVAPQSVEAVISELETVRECLVVGVSDDHWGQRVVALLIVSTAAEGSAPHDLDAVRHLVKARLGTAAAPHDVVVVDAVPHTALGKPDRRAAAVLADRLLSRGSSTGRG